MHMQVQFIVSIHLIHVVFHKSQTCNIFCFIFTKGLYWSMLRGGACINYGVVWALHHCDSQAPPTVPHKGITECLNGVTERSCAHVNTWMTLSRGPAWLCPPQDIICLLETPDLTLCCFTPFMSDKAKPQHLRKRNILSSESISLQR